MEGQRGVFMRRGHYPTVDAKGTGKIAFKNSGALGSREVNSKRNGRCKAAREKGEPTCCIHQRDGGFGREWEFLRGYFLNN